MQGDEPNTKSYDTSLPVIGEVMDLAQTFRTIVIGSLAVLLLLLVLIVFLITRAVRRKRNNL